MGRARGPATKGHRGRAEAAKQEPGDTSHQHMTERGENEETGMRGCNIAHIRMRS
jgi:hypothetical protein